MDGGICLAAAKNFYWHKQVLFFVKFGLDVLRNVHLKLIVRHPGSLKPPYLIVIIPRGWNMTGIWEDITKEASHFFHIAS